MTAFHVIPILHVDILQNRSTTKTVKRGCLRGCFPAGQGRVQKKVEKPVEEGMVL